MKLFSVLLLLGIGVCFGSEDSKNSDLDGSESNQSYGYGYGTKVADQFGESTVYVHGFGTTNDNEIDHYNDYNNEVPPASNYIYDKPAYGHYQAPVYHPKPYAPAPTYYDKGGYLQGYGYGHIDGYGNARHGYGFGKRYGYEAPVYNEYAHAPVYNEYPHAPAPVQAPAPAGFQPGPLGVPPSLSGPHTPSLGHGFGYGFTHF